MNGLENNHEAGDLRRYGAHYNVIVLGTFIPIPGYTIFMLRQALEPGSRNGSWSFSCKQRSRIYSVKSKAILTFSVMVP